MVTLFLGVILCATLLILFWQVSNLISIVLGAPPINSPSFDLLHPLSDPKKTVIDLGCGSGSLVIAAAPYFDHVYGMEYSPWFYWVSKLRTRNHKNVTIIYGNIMSKAWPDVDYVYCYLLPPLLKRLTPRFKKSKAIILSFGFKIPEWKEVKCIKSENQYLYVYEGKRNF